VRAVLATLRPLGRDAEGLAHAAARAFGADLHAEIGGDAAGLFRLALAATRSGRSARDDGLDEAAADRLVDDLIRGDVHLEERHGALDVDADGPG
jgi:hypothetical protein